MGKIMVYREGFRPYGAKLEYPEFRREVMEILKEICGPEYEVKENKVLKNNSVELYGITLGPTGAKVYPTVYLEELYKSYKNGKYSLDDAAHEVLRAGSRSTLPPEFDVESFNDFKKVRAKLVYHLVNYDRNKKLLKDIPHRRWMDLALIYSVYLGRAGKSTGSITIRNEHIDSWGVEEDELFNAAENNTCSIFPARLKAMQELLQELMGGRSDREYNFTEKVDGASILDDMGYDMDEPPMYVLSNPQGFHGASSVLYPGLLEGYADEFKQDIYLLPSSIHEFILVPKSLTPRAEDLSAIVSDVNRSAVNPEEFLSDSVYLYSREDKRVMQV